MSLDPLYITLAKFPERVDSWNSLTRHCMKHKKFNIVKDFPDLPWVWDIISRRAPMELIEYFSDKELDWSGIDKNPNFKIEMVRKYPQKDWDWYDLLDHPQFKVELVEEFPDKRWNWYELSGHPELELRIVEKFQEKGWNWDEIIKHKDFNIEFAIILLATGS